MFCDISTEEFFAGNGNEQRKNTSRKVRGSTIDEPIGPQVDRGGELEPSGSVGVYAICFITEVHTFFFRRLRLSA